MRRLWIVLLVMAGCTVTTTAEDGFGNRVQTPPFWGLLPGTAEEVHVGARNGTGRVAVFSYPGGGACEVLMGRSAAKMGKALAGFRLVEPRPWRDRDQFVAGAAYRDGVGTAYCSGGFVVVLTAQRSMWETHREGMLRMAGSFRRKALGDRPVFDLAPLGRVRPDGSLISREE